MSETTTPWPLVPGSLVTARFAQVYGDSSDEDYNTEWVPLVGQKLIFTPSITGPIVYDPAGAKIIAELKPFLGVVNPDGFVVATDGGHPIRLLPTNDPLMSRTGWLWTCTWSGGKVSFPAASSGEVNIADFISAPPENPVAKEWVERIPELMALIEAGTNIDAADVGPAVQDYLTANPHATQFLPDDTLAFSVVDEDGRRTWLEVAADGGPSDYAAGKAALPVEQNELLSDLIFAVVDEDGRRTEMEIGQDGRFTQRVVNSIAARMPPAPEPTDPTTIVLPAATPLVVGRAARINFDSVIANADPSYAPITSRPGNAGSYWTTTPSTAGSATLTITVKDRVDATVTAKSTALTYHTAPSGAGRRHLAIGDSITRAGNYVSSALAEFSGAVSVGTRTYNAGSLSVEGRGGWSLNRYFTEVNAMSPFLFPTSVAGDKYLGSVEFWRKVCYDDPNGYDYDGFQHIARGWQPSPAPFLYDSTGYPLSPSEGDVVFDVSFAEGARYRQFTSGNWVAMSAQPSMEINFPKYMARFAAAFPNGGATSISIMLETNDFFNGLSEASFDIWRSRIDVLIASIRAWSATVPIILLLAPTGGPAPLWVTQTVNKIQFDRRMRDAASRIIETYDTPTQQTNKVYVASALGAIAPENIADYVHPSVPAGHDQLATPLAGMLAKLITEGVA